MPFKDLKKDKESVSSDRETEGDGYCPRCGSLIISKTAGRSYEYQKFWGCDNYPACRFTQRLPPPLITLEPLGPRKRKKVAPESAKKSLFELDVFGLKQELKR